MGDYFVRVSTTTLPIFDGHTITVKTHLSYGDRTDMFGRLYRTLEDGTRETKIEQIHLALVTAYLVDWSVTDRDGQRIPIFLSPLRDIEDKLRGLFPEEFESIHTAIETHQATMAAARAQEKKHWATAEKPTLPSPSDVIGVLTGSVS